MLAVREGASRRWGSMGISRSAALMDKPVQFPSLSALVGEFEAAYDAACGHELLAIHLGLPSLAAVAAIFQSSGGRCTSGSRAGEGWRRKKWWTIPNMKKGRPAQRRSRHHPHRHRPKAQAAAPPPLDGPR